MEAAFAPTSTDLAVGSPQRFSPRFPSSKLVNRSYNPSVTVTFGLCRRWRSSPYFWRQSPWRSKPCSYQRVLAWAGHYAAQGWRRIPSCGVYSQFGSKYMPGCICQQRRWSDRREPSMENSSGTTVSSYHDWRAVHGILTRHSRGTRIQ